jgi:hypothetical protein
MLRRFGRALLYLVLFVIAVVAVTYAGDYAVLRYRVAAQKNPFGQVTVTNYFASQMKNGNTEFDFQPPQSQTCTNSLYPHMGMQPCWYLQRHREQRIDVMSIALPL